MRNYCRKSTDAAFTLIELMVVIVILGILATFIMPRILDRPEQARRVRAKVDIRSIQSALALFKADTGRYPTSAESLAALVTDPGVRGWRKGGYLEQQKLPTDPWKNPYIYRCPGQESRDYEIVTYAKDGEPGGTGDNADIESWNLDDE